MARPGATRKYGKRTTRSTAERLFAELPQSPLRKPNNQDDTQVDDITKRLSLAKITEPESPTQKDLNTTKEEEEEEEEEPGEKDLRNVPNTTQDSVVNEASEDVDKQIEPEKQQIPEAPTTVQEETKETLDESILRDLTWDDVCAPGDQITKIAEASFAEVYRVTNDRGTSIIKVIRLESPIKPQTKAQVRSGLVDEEPREGDDVQGELQISEWLADIPGFVVYKERYVVRGKAPRQLIETHQAFQKKMKRQDPDRAQFYPSPTRYLDNTKFLVVELGDAGQALEDWKLTSVEQIWDIFFLEAIALARAEDIAMFEHRDLHEGNICLKQVSPPRERRGDSSGFFGYSGVDITILDYGLSRAEDLSIDDATPIAYDMEKDLSLFTSVHAPQCKVYRQMRSFILRADRKCLPPQDHTTPYAKGIDGPLSWEVYAPYTNVLWLAYLYEYLVQNYAGDKKELNSFKKMTREMWQYLNPDAKNNVPCFGSAEDIVGFAVEAGWIREDQLMEMGTSMLDKEDSIIISRDDWDDEGSLRRSPRRKRE